MNNTKLKITLYSKRNFCGRKLNNILSSSLSQENFVNLLRELRGLFEPQGLLITAAVHAAAHAVDVSYDVPQVTA